MSDSRSSFNTARLTDRYHSSAVSGLSLPSEVTPVGAAISGEQPHSSAPSFNVLDRDRLYQEFAPLVGRLIRQYGGDDAEACQDLAGEIYCRFCALLEAYDPKRGVPLRPYLVRQLTAAIYTYARRRWTLQRREVSLDQESHLREPAMRADPTPMWDQALLQASLLTILPEAISQLPKRQRQVVIWRYYEDRSFTQIASFLGVQEATARSLLRHALTSLRKKVAPLSGMSE
jgi:RNA polymerase sigma factor (sigma-70 family)